LKMKNRVTLSAALILLGLLAGCDFFMGSDATEGTITLQIGAESGGTRAHFTNMEIKGFRYELEFRGPGGQVINRSATTGTVSQTLALGEWTVTAKAYDSGNVQRAAGRKTVTVTQGKTSDSISMGSSNANLSNLTISGIGTLTPSTFSPDTLVYSSSGFGWLLLTATSSDSDATISINGASAKGSKSANVEFDFGGFLANSYTIVVTAQDGITTKTYTVN
jgi:hypothetical protein